MSEPRSVDVNLFVYNGEATVAAAIEAVLAQTWQQLTLTVIDNGSTDRTAAILADYAGAGRVRIRRNRVNIGPVQNCQKAFWEGDADFVMPKTADDLIAPDFIERIMDQLLRHPDCAMCHAGGLVFSGAGRVQMEYPADHRLLATGDDPIARACHVMTRYTSAPSFWGIYRRAAVDRLARIAYRAGWDHVLLAELALYGEIRHVPVPLFWRRDGGKPVGQLAQGCTEAMQRGLSLDDRFAEHRWRTPLITTAYGHLELFAQARLPEWARRALMERAVAIFRTRWEPLLQQEAAAFNGVLPELMARVNDAGPVLAGWMARQLREAMSAIEAILPDQDFSRAWGEMAAGRRLLQES